MMFYFWLEENFVTDLVPSEMACFANSPGRMRRTAVWISREEMVDFFEYDASSATSHHQPRSTLPKRAAPSLTRRLSRNALEDIVDERVQDGHSLVRDTRIRVDLLEDYVAPPQHALEPNKASSTA